MGLEGIVLKIYKLAELITRVLFINILWIVFSIAGLVVFGVFPSTAAMFSVVRKWILGEKDLPIVKTFWTSYKEGFIQTNLIGLALLILGAILYIDLRFFQTSDNLLFQGLSFLFIVLLFIFFVVLLYIFPVYAHYQFKTFEYIKYSIILAIGKPLQTIMMIVAGLIVLTILKVIPILTLYFGGSLLCFVLTWIAIKSFPTDEIQ